MQCDTLKFRDRESFADVKIRESESSLFMDVFTRKGRKLNRWTFQYFFAESNAGVNLIFFYRRVIIVLWHKDVRIVRCMSRGMTRGFDQSGCFISGFFTTLPIDKNLFTMAYCCCYRCCIFKLKSWARNNELNEGLIPYVHFHKQNGCLALAMTCTSIFGVLGTLTRRVYL